MRDYVEIDPGSGGDLAPKIVEGHKKSCSKLVCLALKLSVRRVPTHHILLAAPDALRVISTVQKVVPKLMRQGEIDTAR